MQTEAAITADWLIQQLGMQAHPEGGHYVETFRQRPAAGGRGAVTCIYFLLQAGERGAWHRVDATEIWHYAGGAPLELALAPVGAARTASILGLDLTQGQQPQLVVPAGCWQAARPLGAWSLASCIVAPAFEFSGFELAPAGWQPDGS